MSKPVLAGGEAMPGPTSEAPTALTSAIHRYRRDVADYSAACDQAAAEGRNDVLPRTYEPAAEAIAAWDRPAESLAEAREALELAIADYDVGRTPRIPAMLRAAHRWMKEQQEKEAAPAERHGVKPVLKSAFPESLALIADHEGLALAHHALVTMLEVGHSFTENPANQRGSREEAVNFIDGIRFLLMREAEAILARAEELSPRNRQQTGFRARVQIEHYTAFPYEGSGAAISRAAIDLATASK